MQESCKTKAWAAQNSSSKIYPVSVRHATYARRFQSSWKPHRSLERHLMAPRHESTTTTGTPTKCISRNCSVHVHYVWKSLKMSHLIKHYFHHWTLIPPKSNFWENWMQFLISILGELGFNYGNNRCSLKMSHFTTLRAERVTFIFWNFGILRFFLYWFDYQRWWWMDYSLKVPQKVSFYNIASEAIYIYFRILWFF